MTQHQRFQQRLRGSWPALFTAAQWLWSKGYDLEIPALRCAPTAAEHELYADSGDVFATRDGERKRFEITGLTVNFTGAADWPSEFYGQAIVDRVHRFEVTKSAPPYAYIKVSKDLRYAAIILQSTNKHWYQGSRLNKKNTGNVEDYVFCPLDAVLFTSMGGGDG